jgi:hypothetical protein
MRAERSKSQTKAITQSRISNYGPSAQVRVVFPRFVISTLGGEDANQVGMAEIIALLLGPTIAVGITLWWQQRKENETQGFVSLPP